MINQVHDEKNKEWIRRRQMRLVQVRKQSNDIAKQLRVRVSNEKQERKAKKEDEVGAKLEVWKMKQLKDLEELYRNAINDIGTAHKMASEESLSGVTSEEKQKLYLSRAKERGETAMENALREKREIIEKKLIPIQRKIITRQIEDLRSSLVRSIPPQKQSVFRNISPKKEFNPKLFESSYEVENPSGRKISCQQNKNEKHKSQTIITLSEDHIKKGQLNPRKQKQGNKMAKQTKRRSDSPKKAKAKADLNSTKSSNMSCPEGEKFWINLGAIEAVTEVEKDDAKKMKESEEVLEVKKGGGRECQKRNGSKGKSVKSETSKKECGREGEHNVECYEYSIHNKCRLSGDVSSVRRIADQAEPDPTELARQEEEQLEQERKEKESRMMMAAERGCKAIEREKINRNYNELLAKLEKLSTKEKLIKSSCHIPPPHMFMSDERRQEKAIRRQRIMDSKFEKIYYESVGINPGGDAGDELNAEERVHGIDGNQENYGTKLDLGEVEWNLKRNSSESVFSGGRQRREKHSKRNGSPVEKVSIKKTPSSFHFKRTKISKGGEIYLSDIDRLLKKTRKLRKDSHKSSEHPPSECKLVAAVSEIHLGKARDEENNHVEEVNSSSFGSVSSELAKSVSLSPWEGPRISEVPIVAKKGEIKKGDEPVKGSLIDLGMGDLGRDFPGIRTNVIAWPVHQVSGSPKSSDDACSRSNATSYRSLPSQILPQRINGLLKLLVQLKEREGKSLVADELIVKMEETLDSLIKEAERSNISLDSEDCQEIRFNPQLNQYITKLLTMSRETIASLNVSSESDTSVPRRGDGTSSGHSGKSKSKCIPENQYLKQLNMNSKCNTLKRARELEKVLKKWKRILGECCQQPSEERRCPMNEMTSQQNSSVFDKCEEVSKKCSKCISGLSNVLANAPSGMREESGACGNVDSNGRKTGSRSKSPMDQPRCQREAPDPCESCRANGSKKGKGSCRQASEARQSESDESLPDVMGELMKKGLLKSPFDWGPPQPTQSTQSTGSESVPCSLTPLHFPTPEDSEIRKYFRPRSKPPALFLCRNSCRGACKFGFPLLSDSERKRLPSDPAGMRDLRKKLEKIPMKYLDPRYGVYSPTQGPRPFAPTPNDSEFMERNFCNPLFTPTSDYEEQENRMPRKMHVKVDRCDRPSSEPHISDKNDCSGSESDGPCPGGTYKRPKSTSGKWQDSDEWNSDCPAPNDGTYIKDGPYIAEASYETEGGVNQEAGGTFTLDRESGNRSPCGREEMNRTRTIAENVEGGQTWVKGDESSCMHSCAVHCSGGGWGCPVCGRQASSGSRNGCGLARSNAGESACGMSEFSGCPDNQFSSAGGAQQGGCANQGMSYDKEDECDNSDARFSSKNSDDCDLS